MTIIPDLILTLVLYAVLIALAVIDARTFRLPDWLTLPLIPAGWAAAWLMGAPLWAHLAGAAAGYGALVLVELAYRRLRGRDGIGRGDAKLLAVGGAWCGIWLLPVILLAASVMALVGVLAGAWLRGERVSAHQRLAFGPYLAAGIALAWALAFYAPWLTLA